MKLKSQEKNNIYFNFLSNKMTLIMIVLMLKMSKKVIGALISGENANHEKTRFMKKSRILHYIYSLFF